MAKWVGLVPVDYEGMTDGRLLQEAGIYPPSPILPEADWFAIWDYYRATAPSQLPAAARTTLVPTGLKRFKARKLSPHSGVPMTCLVQIDPARHQIRVGDAFGGSFFLLNPSGEVQQRLRLGSPVVSVFDSGHDSLLLTLIGRLFPSDSLEGSVVVWDRQNGAAPDPVLQNLRRPTDSVLVDLNGDGLKDIVNCSFGHRLGRFSWFEGKPDNRFEEHVLLDRPGAIRCEVADLTGDGLPDIVVLTAQAREGIYLFVNEGKGRFRLSPLLEMPPSWGLASFSLADFNRDGHPDLVVANGDHGDFPLPLKPYHGVRIYLNDGRNQFHEVFHFPLAGAYKAVARDFDGDGDLDLAAIAFYPDYTREQPESFVYLENQGEWRFTASTCAEQNLGRWMVMDAGDLDGDGDEDIVLGSFVRGPTTVPVPAALRDRWRTDGAPLLLLENTTR